MTFEIRLFSRIHIHKENSLGSGTKLFGLGLIVLLFPENIIISSTAQQESLYCTTSI